MVEVTKFIDTLGDLVGPAHVKAAPEVQAYQVDGHVPWAVVSPGDIDEVAAVLPDRQRAGWHRDGQSPAVLATAWAMLAA
jgi:hypothetical protein